MRLFHGASQSALRAPRGLALARTVHATPRLLVDTPKPFAIDPDASVEDVLQAYEKHIIERTQHHLGVRAMVLFWTGFSHGGRLRSTRTTCR